MTKLINAWRWFCERTVAAWDDAWNDEGVKLSRAELRYNWNKAKETWRSLGEG